jgi:hypothetical protein
MNNRKEEGFERAMGEAKRQASNVAAIRLRDIYYRKEDPDRTAQDGEGGAVRYLLSCQPSSFMFR